MGFARAQPILRAVIQAPNCRSVDRAKSSLVLAIVANWSPLPHGAFGKQKGKIGALVARDICVFGLILN
jgi:hypothetical protein